MWKTVSYTSKKMGKSLDKVFDKMSDMFEEMADAMDEDAFDGLVDSNHGEISITNNHGHIVIVGRVLSLNVNGITYDVDPGDDDPE